MIHWWAFLCASLIGLLVLASWWGQVPSNPLAGIVDDEGVSMMEAAVRAELRAWSTIVGDVERAIRPPMVGTEEWSMEEYGLTLDQLQAEHERNMRKDALNDGWEPEPAQETHWVSTIMEAEAYADMDLPKMDGMGGQSRYMKANGKYDHGCSHGDRGRKHKGRGRRRKPTHRTWEQ